MTTSIKAFDNASALQSLNEEHAEISRRYTRLESTIRLGRTLGGIVEAANGLVQMVLLHFVHEEQFLEKLSLPSFPRQRDANIEITALLFDIETGLEQGKAGTLSLLLLLGKVWMKEHMQLECEQFVCEELTGAGRPFAPPPLDGQPFALSA